MRLSQQQPMHLKFSGGSAAINTTLKTSTSTYNNNNSGLPKSRSSMAISTTAATTKLIYSFRLYFFFDTEIIGRTIK
jgi:hypothetical protein